MRSFLPATPLRALARLAGAAAVAVALSACSFITGVPDVARVELQVPITVIAPGQAVQASGVPVGNGGSVITHSRRQVSYSSSDDAVATVSPAGLITGVAPGRATIRASSDGKSASVEMTVRPVPVRQVLIRPRSPIVRLAPSVTVLLEAAVVDTNNQLLANRPPTWTSLDQNVATISAAGAITPRALGAARIVASVDTGLAPLVGKVADTVTVRVTPVPIISVRVTPTAPTLYTGQTQQFTATVVDSLQQVVTDRRVVWSTTDRGSVLAVDSLTGLATAVAPSAVGTTITASVETVPGFPALDFQRGSTTVSVLAPAANARVVNASGIVVTGTTLRVGASQQVTLQALDVVGTSLAGRQYRVTSDTPAVATVSATGLITAGSTPGSATITVQALDANGTPQGTAATFVVTVTP
jgi:uncharacterized protein YjdB